MIIKKEQNIYETMKTKFAFNIYLNNDNTKSIIFKIYKKGKGKLAKEYKLIIDNYVINNDFVSLRENNTIAYFQLKTKLLYTNLKNKKYYQLKNINSENALLDLILEYANSKNNVKSIVLDFDKKEIQFKLYSFYTLIIENDKRLSTLTKTNKD